MHKRGVGATPQTSTTFSSASGSSVCCPQAPLDAKEGCRAAHPPHHPLPDELVPAQKGPGESPPGCKRALGMRIMRTCPSGPIIRTPTKVVSGRSSSPVSKAYLAALNGLT